MEAQPSTGLEPRTEQRQSIKLLAADPDLGSGLTEADFERATEQAVFPAIELAEGPLLIDDLRGAPDVQRPLHGFLVVEGALTVNLRMSGRTCTRLIGAHELVLIDGIETDSIPISWEWSVLEPARLALLDARLLPVGSDWPPVKTAVLERAAQQTRNAFLQQAISQLPRVEERLLALFWSVADRRGVVRPDGVWLKLSATHETLAHMVGAQRPTVSLGLRQLAEEGLVQAEDDGWLLARDSVDAFAETGPAIEVDTQAGG